MVQANKWVMLLYIAGEKTAFYTRGQMHDLKGREMLYSSLSAKIHLTREEEQRLLGRGGKKKSKRKPSLFSAVF